MSRGCGCVQNLSYSCQVVVKHAQDAVWLNLRQFRFFLYPVFTENYCDFVKKYCGLVEKYWDLVKIFSGFIKNFRGFVPINPILSE